MSLHISYYGCWLAPVLHFLDIDDFLWKILIYGLHLIESGNLCVICYGSLLYMCYILIYLGNLCVTYYGSYWLLVGNLCLKSCLRLVTSVLHNMEISTQASDLVLV